ncbi:MAG: hypothetical protein QXM96_04075 [Candidatus Woesearchaeota archaeon]
MDKKKIFFSYVFINIFFLIFINLVFAASNGQSFVRALNPFWNLISYIFKDLLKGSMRYIFLKFLVWMLLWVFLILLAPKALEALKSDNDTAKKQANIITFLLSLIMTIGIPEAALEFIFSSYAFFGFIFIMLIGPAIFMGGKTPQNNFARGGMFILIGIIIYAYDNFANNIPDFFIFGATLSIIYGIIMWINGLSNGGKLSEISLRNTSNPKSIINQKDIEQENDPELKLLKQEIKALFELNREFSKEINVIQNNVSDIKKKNILIYKREINLKAKIQRLRNIESQFSVALSKPEPIINLIEKVKNNSKFSQINILDKKTPWLGFDNVVNAFIKNYKILISLLRDYALYKGELLGEKEEYLVDLLKEHIEKLKKTFEIVGKTPDSETLKLETQVNNLENEITAAIEKGKKQKKEKILKLIRDLETYFNNMDNALNEYGSLINTEANYIKKIEEYLLASSNEKYNKEKDIIKELNKYINSFKKGLNYLRNVTFIGIKEEKEVHNLISELSFLSKDLEKEDLIIEKAYNIWIAWVKQVEQDVKKLGELENDINTNINIPLLNKDLIINLLNSYSNELINFYKAIQDSESVCRTLIVEYKKLAQEVENL